MTGQYSRLSIWLLFLKSSATSELGCPYPVFRTHKGANKSQAKELPNISSTINTLCFVNSITDRQGQFCLYTSLATEGALIRGRNRFFKGVLRRQYIVNETRAWSWQRTKGTQLRCYVGTNVAQLVDTDNGLAVHGKLYIEPTEWLIRNCSLMSMPGFNQR